MTATVTYTDGRTLPCILDQGHRAGIDAGSGRSGRIGGAVRYRNEQIASLPR